MLLVQKKTEKQKILTRRICESARVRERVQEDAEGVRGHKRMREGSDTAIYAISTKNKRKRRKYLLGGHARVREDTRGYERMREGMRGCERMWKVREDARGCKRMQEDARGCKRVVTSPFSDKTHVRQDS